MFFDPFPEVFVIVADAVGAVLSTCICRFFAVFIFDLSPQIDVTDIKNTVIDLCIHSTSGAFQVICMGCIDMGKGLSVLHQWCDDVIHPLDTLRSLVDPFPAGYQEFPVTVIRVFGGIDLFVHPAVDPFATAVTDIRGFFELCTLLRLVFFAYFTAPVFPAGPTRDIAFFVPAYMPQGTSGMDIGICLTGDTAIPAEFLYFGVPPDFF